MNHPALTSTAAEHARPCRGWRARLAATVLGAAASATALAGPPPSADLAVRFDAPAAVRIAVPETYSVTVENRGRQASSTIQVQLRFALTSTSPQVAILGTVSGIDPRCSLSGTQLNCTLAGLRRGYSTTLNFAYTAPVATKPLQITASVSSTTADPVPGNNSATVLPSLVYPTRPMLAGAVNVRACTGTALSSFFECTMFPSALIGFSAQMKADQSIEFAQPGYSGSWSQNPAQTSLSMVFFEDQGSGPVQVVSFSGWAVNGSRCFHGMATHTQNPNYVSPYEVCMP